MRSVPIEILNQIFTFLLQEDLFKSIYVCHLWKNIIEQSLLFRNLRIFSSPTIKRYTNKIKKNVVDGSKVEQVEFYLNDAKPYDISEFLKQLPNLRTYKCHIIRCQRFYINNINNINMYPWHGTIEAISETTASTVCIDLLKTAMCPHLNTLSIWGYGNRIIPLLKNAPSLVTLTLRGGRISVPDLDVIHSALPLLETFSLIDKFIVFNVLDESTVPAKSVADFIISNNNRQDIQSQINLLRYIRIKYPNVQQLVYRNGVNRGQSQQEKKSIQLAWNTFLQNVGPQLKKLEISYDDEIDAFLDAFDKSQCQIRDLHFNVHSYYSSYSALATAPNFARSQQALFIKTLVLNNSNITSFGWLKALISLESLNIQAVPCAPLLPFDFNVILQNRPETLLSLSLSNFRLFAQIISTVQCNIKTLNLHSCFLSPNIDLFISRHIPLLSNLTLNRCLLHTKKLDMKYIDLETFCYIEPACKITKTVLVNTYSNSDQRWYSTKKSEFLDSYFNSEKVDSMPKEYPPAVALSISEIKEIPYFILNCRSLGQIYIHLPISLV